MKPKHQPQSSRTAAEGERKEIRAGIADLDAGAHVNHRKVKRWLHSWGKPNETKAPR